MGHYTLFQQGQRVRIVAGELAALEAVFDVAKGETRAAVLLDLLGRQNRVKVGVDDLVAALRGFQADAKDIRLFGTYHLGAENIDLCGHLVC